MPGEVSFAEGVKPCHPAPEQAHGAESSRADQDRWWRRSIDEQPAPKPAPSQPQPGYHMATPFSNGHQQHAPPRAGGGSSGSGGGCGVVVTAQRGYSLPDMLGVAPPKDLTIPEHPERAASGCAPDSAYIQPRTGANTGVGVTQQQQQEREALPAEGGNAWPRRRLACQPPPAAASPTAASAAAAALALLPLTWQPAPPRRAALQQLPSAAPGCGAPLSAAPAAGEAAPAAAAAVPLPTPECGAERGPLSKQQ